MGARQDQWQKRGPLEENLESIRRLSFRMKFLRIMIENHYEILIDLYDKNL